MINFKKFSLFNINKSIYGSKKNYYYYNTFYLKNNISLKNFNRLISQLPDYLK